MGGNRALHTNPFIVNGRTVDIHITTRGSDWYWAVMSVMGITMLAILAISFLKPACNRLFYYILSLVAFVAMVEHYSMASNLGWVPIDVEWRRSSHLVSGVNRQIWWVRYCGWFLIWPLLSATILLASVVPGIQVFWTCFLSCSMAILAVVGAVVRTDYKWGYYGFWIWCWLLIGYQLIWLPRKFALARGKDVAFAHNITAGWVWMLWMLYPICWGVSEGGNVIPPDSEFIFYGILDCCLIPITSAFFLFSHWTIDPSRLGLKMRTYDDPLNNHSTSNQEKMASRGQTDGITEAGDASQRAPVTEGELPATTA
ncbi:uncharacterized protein Z519_02767 [Cladophialophora bantiana CBS 173.52]|uniref:Uncharacterized protein n=1 Tax=Cladophialophora bantiana (strain ATCC 10958 / CBS 173.52 / CDC B-1940 / NIH 8579) TaxID=1442370 RepID=A0A0D2I2D7_CLAB1|nr:uncharacterized protein Z519_02767 [Cladophialophora bantiana CBS 173.52]KIW97375.1 hypothetical protein Z519_02767 [Cladophialophora bantiana CBS 173.52]